MAIVKEEVLDYSEMLLRARENLKQFEICMNNRHFKEGHEYMMNAFVDIRLLTHISGELSA